MAGESIFEITLRAKAWDEARERELPHGFRCASRAKCSGQCPFAGKQMKKAWIGLQRRDELKRAETTTLDTCVISMISSIPLVRLMVRYGGSESVRSRQGLRSTNGTDLGSAMYPD